MCLILDKVLYLFAPAMNDWLCNLSNVFYLKFCLCSWSFFHLSETFLSSVGHVYVAVADQYHFIHDRSEPYIVRYNRSRLVSENIVMNFCLILFLHSWFTSISHAASAIVWAWHVSGFVYFRSLAATGGFYTCVCKRVALWLLSVWKSQWQHL